MRLLTWNLNGLDENHLDERTEAAVFIALVGARLDQLQARLDQLQARLDQLQDGNVPHGYRTPDVMVFQEVTPRMFDSCMQQHLLAAKFAVLPSAAPDKEIFEVIAVRAPFHVRAYEGQVLAKSRYSRFLHCVDVQAGDALAGDGGTVVKIATGHFDNGTDAAKIRDAQLRQVNAIIGDVGIFLGDANLRKAEWESASSRLAMRDAWSLVGEPEDCRVTWRSDKFSARFDRVFVGTQINPTAMSACPSEPLPRSGAVISDHVGLIVDIDLP